MRAAIYDQYLDSLGGGERYVMTIAVALKKAGWEVDVQWNNPKILLWLSERLGLDLKGINIVPDVAKGAGYDFIFWISDGSIPLLFAKKNILHFQTPFKNVSGGNILNRLKLLKISKVICNSNFTKNIIDQEYGLNSRVIYPPVSINEFKSGTKENIILSVGRFSQLQQAKRQDVLVDTFKKMCKKGLKGWQLIIIGGSDVGAGNFVEDLKKEAKGSPIKILENLPFDEIKKYYAKSKIFWTASGFNIDEMSEPQRVEHFGIVVVEAMAAGCIPVITNKGGHPEIIEDEIDGFLWDTIENLEEITQLLIKDEKKGKEIAKNAIISSRKFSEDNFKNKIIELATK